MLEKRLFLSTGNKVISLPKAVFVGLCFWHCSDRISYSVAVDWNRSAITGRMDLAICSTRPTVNKKKTAGVNRSVAIELRHVIVVQINSTVDNARANGFHLSVSEVANECWRMFVELVVTKENDR